MTDIARLREALADYNIEGALVGDDVFDVVFDAARELLTIREAGALIVTPDEKLVERIARGIYESTLYLPKAGDEWKQISEKQRVYYRTQATAVLDALRDGDVNQIRHAEKVMGHDIPILEEDEELVNRLANILRECDTGGVPYRPTIRFLLDALRDAMPPEDAK